MTEHYDDNASSERLANAIAAVFQFNKEATTEEMLFAAMQATATIIASIDCPGCRHLTADNAIKEFPKFVATALQMAAENDGDASPHDHRH